MTDALDRLLPRLEPELAAAVLAALQDVRDGVDYPRLERGIAAGDVAEIEAALNIEQGSWAPYVAAALAIFMQSGRRAGVIYGVRFDPVQDAEFRADLSAKVSAMAEEQRVKARDYVQRGLMEGRSQRSIAEGLVGRRSRATGKRTGGLIGLSRAQQSWVETMARRLSSDDPEEIRAALGVKERDKRYDPLIKRAAVEARKARNAALEALEAGAPPIVAPKPSPLTPAKIEEITGKFADRLLRKRAKDIAKVEVQQFAAGAREEAVRQAVAKVPGASASKTWEHSHIIEHARVDHLSMDGQVRDLEGVWIMSNGAMMRYAHDPRGGAANNASCRCRTRYRLILPEGVM